jgi:hypothetical protein
VLVITIRQVRKNSQCRKGRRLACLSPLFIAIQGKANVLLLEAALCEEARLAGSFPNVLRRLGSESFVPHGESLVAPTLSIHIHALHDQVVANASLSQLITNLQRPPPARHSLQYETLSESSIG